MIHFTLDPLTHGKPHRTFDVLDRWFILNYSRIAGRLNAVWLLSRCLEDVKLRPGYRLGFKSRRKWPCALAVLGTFLGDERGLARDKNKGMSRSEARLWEGD